MPPVCLGISASSRSFSLALRLSDGRLHGFSPARGASASDLVAAVADLLKTRRLTPSDLQELRLDVGPGSYTGLRVALTFARLVASFREIPILTTTSLQLTALATWAAGSVGQDRMIRPVFDARRKRFHHALVRLDSKTTCVETPRATSLEELAAALTPDEVVTAESTMHTTLTPIVQCRGATLATASVWNASLLFDDRIELQETSVHELEPLYLMGSYAE